MDLKFAYTAPLKRLVPIQARKTGRLRTAVARLSQPKGLALLPAGMHKSFINCLAACFNDPSSVQQPRKALQDQQQHEHAAQYLYSPEQQPLHKRKSG